MISNKEFKELLEKVLKAEPVYIKETGIKVLVTSYNKQKRKRRAGVIQLDNNICTISFLEAPNKKAMDKTISYDLEVVDTGTGYHSGNRKSTSVITVNNLDLIITATISIKDLRAVPFKSAGAEVLFGKDKT